MQKIITIFKEERGDGDWVPDNLAECIDWLKLKLNSIQTEYRDSASIEIDSSDSYGSSYPKLTISYTRPETAEEIASREAYEKRTADDRRARELRQLAELKAKYVSDKTQ